LSVEAKQQESPVGCNRLPSPGDRVNYRITVRLAAGVTWSTWLGAEAADNGDGTTTICAVVDQAALRGILCRLWDLNATLIAATWTPRGPRPEGGTQ
jgi:hypothetical protein